MKISVGTLSPDDGQEWKNLYRGYAEIHYDIMNNEILDTVWNQIFDEDKAFYDLVANNEEKRPVGLMHFREMASPLRGKNVGFLDDLFVVPRSHVEQKQKTKCFKN